MKGWRRFLATLQAGLLCLAVLLPLAACGPTPEPKAPSTQAEAADPIPGHARETLAYVREHGYPPPGYVGGRVFGNYEGLLPRFDRQRRRIEYREWDVRPRAEGRARGTERLVTGSDGRAWFTADHYRSFREVK